MTSEARRIKAESVSENEAVGYVKAGWRWASITLKSETFITALEKAAEQKTGRRDQRAPEATGRADSEPLVANS